MKTSSITIKLYMFLIYFILFCASLSAQLIVEQAETNLPVSYTLIPEDKEFNSDEEMNSYILSLPINKIKEAALAEGMDINEEKTILYLDGQNIAFETKSEEEGETSVVIDGESGAASMIYWDKKMVIVIQPGDMEKIQKQYPSSNTVSQAQNSEIRPSGKKSNINGFDCEEYIGKVDGDPIIVWASSKNADVMDKLEQVYQKILEIFPPENGEDINEWELVKNKIPVEVISISSGMTGEPTVDVQTITSIKKENPPAQKFKVPTEAEGFTKSSMMDMMKQIMMDDKE